MHAKSALFRSLKNIRCLIPEIDADTVTEKTKTCEIFGSYFWFFSSNFCQTIRERNYDN